MPPVLWFVAAAAGVAGAAAFVDTGQPQWDLHCTGACTENDWVSEIFAPKLRRG